MGKNYCPSCGSKDVDFTEDGTECLECGFKSKEFPEEHMLIEGEDEDAVMDKIKQSRPKIIVEEKSKKKSTKSKSKPKAKPKKAKSKSKADAKAKGKKKK